MHILYISQYYAPEIGAASERITGLAFHLNKLGHKVTVITGFPNYPFGKVYPGYKKRLFLQERQDGVRVIRVWLFTTHRTCPVSRLLNYLSFMCSSILASFFSGGAEYTVATSGPLFVALAGYVISKMKRTPFIFDVRDVWPERIYAGTCMKRGMMIKMLEMLEIFLYRHAVKIIAVTNGVKENIASKDIPQDKITVITNGVDTRYFSPAAANKTLAGKLGLARSNFVAIYVGTLGLLQDLHLIAASAERLKKYHDIVFIIVGSGAKRDEFIDRVKRNGLTNVKILPPILQRELCDYINLSDIGINANTDHPHNSMAIPVKIFPYMACAKPIVLANNGEIARVVKQYNIGECVTPGDAEAFTRAVLKFYNNRELCKQCGKNGYLLVNERFSLDRLARTMSDVIISN